MSEYKIKLSLFIRHGAPIDDTLAVQVAIAERLEKIADELSRVRILLQPEGRMVEGG